MISHDRSAYGVFCKFGTGGWNLYEQFFVFTRFLYSSSRFRHRSIGYIMMDLFELKAFESALFPSRLRLLAAIKGRR